jgi:hypothetical protein
MVMDINIKSRTIIVLIGIFIALMVSANVLAYLLKFVIENPNIENFRIINLDMEANIPTFFSAVLLLLASLLLGLIALCKKNMREPYVFHWTLLCLIFAYLALDEAAVIHEVLNRPLREMFDLKGIFYYSSVIPGIIVTLLISISYFKFFLNLANRLKVFFVISFILFVGGAIGMELIGGWYAGSISNNTLTYGILTTVEESLEMVGIGLFIYGLLDYIRTGIKQVRLKFI